MLATAVAAAQSGAVAMLLPMNVQFGRFATRPKRTRVGIRPHPARTRPARKAPFSRCRAAAQSRKPLFVAGRGAHLAGARDALIRLADKVGAGLATTLKAKDMFRGHPLDLGMVGSFSNAGGRRVIDQADCVVVFGAEPQPAHDELRQIVAQDVPLIQVDCVRSDIGRWYHADVAVVGASRRQPNSCSKRCRSAALRTSRLHAEEVRRELAASISRATSFRPTRHARWTARAGTRARSPASRASQRLLRRRQFPADRSVPLGART